MDRWIWIRVKTTTIQAARAALSILGVQLHNEARVDPDPLRKGHLRAEGDHYISKERELGEATNDEGGDEQQPGEH